MRINRVFTIASVWLAMASVSACQGDPGPAAQGADSDPSATLAVVTSPAGKPTAPIDISYEVIGNAIVGTPVSINVVVTSAMGPVKVHYSIMDNSAVMFRAGQVERLEITDPVAGSLQQLSVVPQREGRVYVNVSAEIAGQDGLLIRSMAIPIKVGSAPQEATVNGELIEAPGGETVISMPATESNE